MKKEKEVTIDDLAVMVQKGFIEMGKNMDKRFEKVEGDMKTMSTQIDKLQRGQVNINDRLDEITSDKKVIKNHEKRISVLEKRTALAI